MIVARASMLEMRSVQPYELLPPLETYDAPIRVNGTTPLFLVNYTPKGKTEAKTYGVFYIGQKPGEKQKYGLRALLKDGKTMFKKTHPLKGSGFYVAAEKCERIEELAAAA